MDEKTCCANNKLGIVLMVIGVLTIIPVVAAIIMKTKKA